MIVSVIIMENVTVPLHNISIILTIAFKRHIIIAILQIRDLQLRGVYKLSSESCSYKMLRSNLKPEF